MPQRAPPRGHPATRSPRPAPEEWHGQPADLPTVSARRAEGVLLARCTALVEPFEITRAPIWPVACSGEGNLSSLGTTGFGMPNRPHPILQLEATMNRTLPLTFALCLFAAACTS